MKRSEINKALREMEAMCREQRCWLPPFCSFTPEEWRTLGREYGEVSQCNDDNTDNRFNPPVGRFPAIEEDEPPYRLLCNEYPVSNG